MLATTAILAAGIGIGTAVAAPPVDTLVSVGSPPTPFSQNKQNEPAVTVDAAHPNVVVAGANEEIDDESCAAGDPSTCPFTDGVGTSGVYFSFTGGQSWTQPTYTGWTARDCLGPAGCTPHIGPIGTVPNYVENGLVSGGDPAVAFGPRPDSQGRFSWSNGSRLYYANLAGNFSATSPAFRGFKAIAVSSSDDIQSAAAGDNAAWSRPVLVSKQSNTTFADKEQIWSDNAESSRFFGNTYICWATFKSNSQGNALPTPLIVARSRDGGRTWTNVQVGSATDNLASSQPDGCSLRTDSVGNVYVFGIATRSGTAYETMRKSTDGGAHWSALKLIASVVPPGVVDPVLGRPVMDGVAGARVDLAAGPFADIANGAPTGAPATNRLVATWTDGSGGLNHEQLMMTTSVDAGATWSSPTAVPLAAGDRPFYAASAISPDGQDVYVTYNAFTTPYRNNTTDPRNLDGVMLHADVSGSGLGTFTELDRSANGDPRGSSTNALGAEFLGDYVYTAATNFGAVGVFNDTSNAADCPAIDAYRASLYTATPMPAPDVLASCPATFGNSDIRGASLSDPTP